MVYSKRNIKVNEDSVQIKNNDLTITIETKTKIYQFTCNGMSDVKRIKDEIIKLKDNSNLLEKASKKSR